MLRKLSCVSPRTLTKTVVSSVSIGVDAGFDIGRLTYDLGKCSVSEWERVCDEVDMRKGKRPEAQKVDSMGDINMTRR